MVQELAYVIVTPHSLNKSRTGGILARLISRSGVELVAARMFAPSPELVEQYAEISVSADDPQDRRIQELIRDYIRQSFSPDSKTGRRRRIMMLLFQGDDAIRRVRSVVGNITYQRRSGETIRDTFGDLILDDDGQVRYMEPAVFAAPTVPEAELNLKLWGRYSDTDGGLLENMVVYDPGEVPERTLVLIKPDNFRFPTGRPGNVIDFFSRTGLSIVAIKVHRMSVAEAMEFYGPVRHILRTRFNDSVGAKARAILERELGFAMPADVESGLGALIGPHMGDHQFDNIVRFMSGSAPTECDPARRDEPGSEKCIAIVYEGPHAIRKIRDVLGPTDPSKAPPGSIRREFGSTVMINAAHASDSPENVQRELGIVRLGQENTFRRVIEQVYGEL
jgi:nucleoside diphosphate kinase